MEGVHGLKAMVKSFPEQMQNDYALALDFSDFLFVLRTVYNMIVSQGENSDANAEWVKLVPRLKSIAAVNLEEIFARLQIVDGRLRRFVFRAKTQMADEGLEELKIEVIRREEELKGSARTLHPEQTDHSQWYGGRVLDYRFGNAKTLLRDIFESEGAPC